jgi:hypothetical protein
MDAGKRRLKLSRWDGADDGWRASLPLQRDWPEARIAIDATSLSFVTTTFMLRLRSFVDYNLHIGKEVMVEAPKNERVANYLSRMGIADGLPVEVFPDLPEVRRHEQGGVLVPIRRLHEPTDVEVTGDELYRLFQGHADDAVAVVADALQEGFTELCNNGVEHGRSALGCYLAAQRYGGARPRVELTIGDLGMGVPTHMRQVFDEESDRRLLRKALEEQVSGTGNKERGNGIPSVLEEAQSARITYASLRIRSGKATLLHHVQRNGQTTTATHPSPFKKGTWICFELGPPT